MQKELENLEKYLNKLPPKDRLDVLIKFLPYTLPKLESMHFKDIEPKDSGSPLGRIFRALIDQSNRTGVWSDTLIDDNKG
jgi:hypothetical protein